MNRGENGGSNEPGSSLDNSMSSKVVSILTHNYLNGYEKQYTRPFGGGLERYVQLLCRVIKEMGLQPVVHQLSYYDSFDTTYEGVRVLGWQFDKERIGEAFERMAGEAEGLLIYASCIWHPIHYRPGSIGICHGINWDRHDIPLQEKQSIASIIHNATQQLDMIVSVDSHFQTYCRSVCEYEESDQIIVIPNPVDTEWFTPRSPARASSHALRVLYPRRLSYERGIVSMMLLTDTLLANHPTVTVEFAGELVEQTPVAIVARLWLEAHPHRGRIILHKYSFEAIRDAYRMADVVVIPTLYSEGTSLSCLEAMSCGIPVVATNIGGLNDIVIDGLNGRLVPPQAEALTAAVTALLEQPRLRRSMAAAARKTALAFDIHKWNVRWQQVIAEQLARLEQRQP